jgi:hypothetical protein
MKRRLGWIVIVGILLFTIALLAIGLISARTELAAARQELAVAQCVLDDAKEQEQIEGFIRISVVSYIEGDKKAAVRFLEYAIYKMADRDRQNIGVLPAKMLKDPVIAKKLGLNKLAKKGLQGNRRFGGG